MPFATVILQTERKPGRIDSFKAPLPMTQEVERVDNVALVFKVFLFVIPAILAEHLLPERYELFYGASFIAGAFLQVLVPPRRYRFFLILGIAGVATVLFAVIHTFKLR